MVCFDEDLAFIISLTAVLVPVLALNIYQWVLLSRDGQTIMPRGDDRFEANDQVYIIGESQQMPLVMEMA